MTPRPLSETLSEHAARILADETAMSQLSAPVDPDDLALPATDPAELAQLTSIIDEQCRFIGTRIDAILQRPALVISQPELVAQANEQLNTPVQTNAQGIFEFGNAPGKVLDALTPLLEDASSAGMQMLKKIQSQAHDPRYFFDLRHDDVAPAMVDDLERVLLKLNAIAPFTDDLLKVVMAHGGTEAYREFEERETGYRTQYVRGAILEGFEPTEHVPEPRISEVTSRELLLRQSLKTIVSLLAQAAVEVQLLKGVLANHYFQSVEVHRNPNTRAAALLEAERLQPGLLGDNYPERLRYTLDILQRTVAIISVIERTVLLLRCRTTAGN